MLRFNTRTPEDTIVLFRNIVPMYCGTAPVVPAVRDIILPLPPGTRRSVPMYKRGSRSFPSFIFTKIFLSIFLLFFRF